MKLPFGFEIGFERGPDGGLEVTVWRHGRLVRAFYLGAR